METTRSDFHVEPLARDTLQERVYRQVAGLILDGGIAPGQMVTIQGLAEAFGVSAMPVREALKRLSAANALTVVSGRSIGIPPLTLERLTDLRNVRREVEGTAISWAAARIDTAAMELLTEHLARMEAAVSAGDTTAYLRANRLFHFEIYRAAGSETLMALIEILWLQISPYFHLLRGSYTSANIHHRAMADALDRADADGARAALDGDIEDAYRLLTDILAS